MVIQGTSFITQNLSTKIGTLAPPITTPNGSIQFNGINQYLSVPTSANLSLAGAFTVEAFIYLQAYASTVPIWNNSALFYIGPNGQLFIYDGANRATTPNGAISLNTWTHTVFVRDTSNNLSIFTNGIRQSNVTYSTAFNTANPNYVARYTTNYTQGYFSNLRIGKSAVYNPTLTTLTVPTAPLTTTSQGATATQLLLNTSYNANYLVDSSANNFTITNVNGAISSALNPFG